jgi:hypothetical protein
MALADIILDQVAHAATDDSAAGIMDGVRDRATVLAMADLAWVPYPEAHSTQWLRKRIVAEARA